MSGCEKQNIHGKPLAEWLTACPVLESVVNCESTFWNNPALQTVAEALKDITFSAKDIEDAEARLNRFAPYIAEVFPETAAMGGLIESPINPAPLLKKRLAQWSLTPEGSLFVKLDSHLPISGSIKARGGIYEVLKLAEDIAVRVGLLNFDDDYTKLCSPIFTKLFGRYSIGVGSTGNLGLSIGLIGRKLGFHVTVHMSSEAMAWKKKLLREIGAVVIEHDADYSVAVAEGRAAAEKDPNCHFVDDENSPDLFLGYAVAGTRLKQQFLEQAIVVDRQHPLFVYLPCGVGGGPGGVAFGLKLAFGDHVHCFFGEPTHAPAMLTGLATGLHENVSAADFGIDNRTIADGLAVSRPSGLVCRVMHHLVSGIFTETDDKLYRLLSLTAESENLRLEPSALIGFSGYLRAAKAQEMLEGTAYPENITHLVWATGGSMVPPSVWEEYNRIGNGLLS